ncbi:iron-containing alcohol dehydrogenase, partial [Enterococcus faecalis]|uniref:iron-containing alcohol dehydrogenase n=1 Tax=Enterococcus faecalis TaxID=1351 RepID=UPI003984C286
MLLNADRLLDDLSDINARAEIQWLASVAHNNFLDAGRSADWGSHRIEHELSAQYHIVHGEGMA